MGEIDTAVAEVEEHWKLELRFREQGNDIAKVTVPLNKVLKNQINMHVLYAFVRFKPRCVVIYGN